MSKKTVSLADIQEAQARITPYIRRTPLLDPAVTLAGCSLPKSGEKPVVRFGL